MHRLYPQCKCKLQLLPLEERKTIRKRIAGRESVKKGRLRKRVGKDQGKEKEKDKKESQRKGKNKERKAKTRTKTEEERSARSFCICKQC